MIDLNLSMFRAYDIRTPSALLTDELAARLARAEAVYFRETLGVPGVILAHDARSSGPRYLEIACEQFVRAGLQVTVIPGVCSTSMFYFAAMTRPNLAAVMVGASHNPAGDTGQKILGPGVRPIAEHIGPEGGLDRIEELYEADTSLPAPAPGLPTITAHSRKYGKGILAYDPTDEYIEYSMNLAGVEAGGLDGLRVTHDYLNGAAGREMMLAFERAGADLLPLHFTADGSFPLGDPNPVKPDVIAAGLDAVRARRGTLAAFFDGDGDRIDFYHGAGGYIPSSSVYALILPLILRRFGRANIGVFADLKSNPCAVVEMARAGARVEVVRNGHSQIKQSLIEDSTMIGAVEESAHYYEAFNLEGRRFCTENTLYIALLVASACHADSGIFDEAVGGLGASSRERLWGYKFPSDELREQALDAVVAHFVSKGAIAMTRMKNGYDLEATLLRSGIPLEIDAETRLAPDWLQVCQRISQSEDRLARWEVVAADSVLSSEAKQDIERIVRTFGAGPEYQG